MILTGITFKISSKTKIKIIKILSKANYMILYIQDLWEYPHLKRTLNNKAITNCSGIMIPTLKKIKDNVKNNLLKCSFAVLISLVTLIIMKILKLKRNLKKKNVNNESEISLNI